MVVCMRSPGDADASAAIGRTVGMPIIACVGPELAIFAFMERDYGIRRAQRYAQAQTGATPLPGSRSDTYTAVDEASLVAGDGIDIDVDLEDEVDMPSLQLVDLDHHEVERDLSQYDPTNKPSGTLLGLAGVDADSGSGPGRAVRVRTPSQPPVPAEAPPVDAATAVQRIRTADHRDQVSDALTAFLRSSFGGALLFVAKQGVAYGHQGFGGRFNEDTVQSILLPLTVPSMFELAVSSCEPFAGPPPADGKAIQDPIFKLFPMDGPPREVVVCPVVLRSRVPMLVYAHGVAGGPLEPRAVAELKTLCEETAASFIRLIKSKK